MELISSRLSFSHSFIAISIFIHNYFSHSFISSSTFTLISKNERKKRKGKKTARYVWNTLKREEEEEVCLFRYEDRRGNVDR